MVRKMMTRAMTAKEVDVTLVKYVTSAVGILLKVILIVAIFSYFGVETTTIAGLLAGVGLAIGTMWGGMLSNLAAGAFMVFLKPFKVGDFVTAGDVVGTVHEIGMFATTIDTPDNIRTFVGNNKIFSNNIQNFSANPYRRVDLKAQLNHTVDHAQAIKLLKERLAKIPNVLDRTGPGRGDPGVQPGRPGPGGAALRPQRQLLAGLFRRQPGHPGDLRRSRLPGARTAHGDAELLIASEGDTDLQVVSDVLSQKKINMN